ncbi:MAG: DNA-processing protein DprA [Nitrososphaerota archaeon]
MQAKYRHLSIEELLGHPLNDIESKYAPLQVFISGSMEIPFAAPRVSIVGSRQASSDALNRAKEIAKILVRNGVIIVSGLARGVDTAAHMAAIENKGRTIAVLGTPLNRFYPPENSELQKLIMREHLAISQFGFTRTTQRKDFVIRNRTMALISDATIITEPGEDSGALSQRWETLRLARPLYISKEVFNKQMSWPYKMLRYGAMKLENPDELLDELPPPGMEYKIPS